ncbi:MAG: hypothetical protein ACRC3A_01795, partial [Culicoidibacterales bacterium]
MSNEQQLENILADSFLQQFLVQPAITDISFNGTDLYVQDNLTGRRKETVLVSKNNGGFKFDAPIAA